jgi:3-hydroxyisobutyrate dehydrogenase-like beta-hydroxyacid dehydrogenase
VTIGFIGLGTMGGPIAARLQAAGYDLVVHDAHRTAAERHVDAGAQWVESPRLLAEAAEIVFSSLPGPAEVEAVALGGDGLLAGVRENSCYFDLSTNSPGVVRRLHAAFAEKRAHMLDAPVSGGPSGAASGKLAIFVGGNEQVFRKHKPMLDAIGDQARYVGPIGSASVAKLVHNCSNYVLNLALAEVFTLGVKAGVAPLVLFEAIRQGMVGRRRTFDGMIDQFLPGKFEPPAFALRLAHKDVSLATRSGASWACRCVLRTSRWKK